jgi:hypothetical protein
VDAATGPTQGIALPRRRCGRLPLADCVMGTSVRMIKRHYGALLDGAGAEIAARLDALYAARAAAAAEGV